MDYYDIVRFHQRGERQTIKRNVTLTEAQAHCQNPETSSSSCTTEEAKAYTEQHGPWFDGYRSQERRARTPSPVLTLLADVMALERSGRRR